MNIFKFLGSALFIALMVLIGCKGDKVQPQSILKGEAYVIADETVTPLIDDQIQVFQSEYPATIKLISKSEAEVLNALLKDTGSIAILSRKLTPSELKVFDKRKIIPKTTRFATDGIVFIRNTNNKDTLIALEDVVNFMKGRTTEDIKGLVFDNPNSSTLRYLMDLSAINKMPAEGVYSFSNNEEAIKYVAKNDGMVGVVGMDWITQPSSAMKTYLNSVSVLSVKGIGSTGYVSPTQESLAEGSYPLARDLFIVNCQGFPGLGMGFASFIAGEKGQRIVLKSGLLPVRIPGRKIITRNNITKEKND